MSKSKSIALTCYEQQMKYFAHNCRIENDQLQKQLLFNTNSSKWTKFENLLALQLRRIMMAKSISVICCNLKPSSMLSCFQGTRRYKELRERNVWNL